MNGYELSNQWFTYVDENPEWADTNVTALYFAILQRCNELRWKTKFRLPALDTMQRIGIRSPKTYYPALEKLIAAGFITVLEQAKNQFTACIIQVNAEVNFTEATTSAGEQQLPRQGNGNYLGKGNIDKQENQANPVNQKLENTQTVTATAFGFEQFWNQYGKKEDRAKCEKKWQALTDKQRLEIQQTLPTYLLRTPELRFRKNPLTYLNGQCWLDEGTPVPITQQKRAAPNPDATVYSDLQSPARAQAFATGQVTAAHLAARAQRENQALPF